MREGGKREREGESLLSSDITTDLCEGEVAAVDVGWLKRYGRNMV